MMPVSDVLRLVSGALQDLEPGLESRWPWTGGDGGSVGLLDFLNDAVQAVALQRPDVLAVTEPVRLEPGMRQRLSRFREYGAKHSAAFLLDIVRNMGRDGEHPGAAVRPVSPTLLLAWACPKYESDTVEDWAYDRTVNKDVFYVYPAVPACPDVWVEATYSAEAPRVCSHEQEFPLPDEYASAVKHYMLASILSGDNESGNQSRADYHTKMYASVLGTKLNVDAGWPRVRSSGAATAGGGAS